MRTSPHQIRSLPYAKATEDFRLHSALQRLRFKNGFFTALLQKKFSTRGFRLFFAEGARGGIRGVLVAKKFSGTTWVGVFVDRKMRRRGVGAQLVEAARSHYQGNISSMSWDGRSSLFWSRTHVPPCPKVGLPAYIRSF